MDRAWTERHLFLHSGPPCTFLAYISVVINDDMINMIMEIIAFVFVTDDPHLRPKVIGLRLLN